MFALKKKPSADGAATAVITQVAAPAAGMFLYFALIRAAPWLLSRFQ